MAWLVLGSPCEGRCIQYPDEQVCQLLFPSIAIFNMFEEDPFSDCWLYIGKDGGDFELTW
jgi:hypothetical protein